MSDESLKLVNIVKNNPYEENEYQKYNITSKFLNSSKIKKDQEVMRVFVEIINTCPFKNLKKSLTRQLFEAAEKTIAAGPSFDDE